jgi:hypothetical protein
MLAWPRARSGRWKADFTVGKEISLERVNEIATLALRHGSRLSGFRSPEREVTEAQIERMQRQADWVRRSGAGVTGQLQETKWPRPAY